MSNKQIRADAKLKNLPEDQLEELWLLRNPLDGEDVLTYAEVQLELPRICGETASKSTLSGFYNWLSLKRGMEESYERGEQAKLKYLTANPDASPESVMAVGQMMFATKSMQTGDLDGFVKLLALAERKASRKLDERRLTLVEAKARKADEAKKALEERKSDGGLSAETLELIERTLGML